MSKAVAKVVQARNGILDCLPLTIRGMWKGIGEIWPKARQPSRDQKPPKTKAQLAYGLTIACAFTLATNACTGGRNIISGSFAQLAPRIVQPSCPSTQPTMPSGKLHGESITKGDLQMAYWLPERRCDC